MNTPDTEWEANMQVETLHSILADISSFEPDGEVYTLVEQAHTELAKLRTIILSRDTYWKERVRKEVEELWHELGKYQGWLGGVMGSEVDSTLMQQPPTKEVREAKALHTAIIMKAKEKVHQTQMKVKSLLDNLK